MPPSACSKSPTFASSGPGKCAAGMAEQLALEQILDDRRAVHGNQSSGVARTEPVNRLDHQFLAGAGLAVHQHGACVRREPPDGIEQFLHDRASPDHAVKLELPGDVGIDLEEPLAPADSLPDRHEQSAQPVEVEGLGQVIERTRLDGLDGRVEGRVAGHQDHLAVRVGGTDGAQHVDPADARHLQIDEHGVRLHRRQACQRVLPVAAEDHFEPETADESFDDGQDAGIVVDHEEAGRVFGHQVAWPHADSRQESVRARAGRRAIARISRMHRSCRPLVAGVHCCS